MGYAVGVIGLSIGDFESMDVDEFQSTIDAFGEHEESLEQECWERMRLLGLMTVQPWSKSRLTAHKLLPLPWDKENVKLEMRKEKKSETPIVSKEEDLSELNKLKR